MGGLSRDNGRFGTSAVGMVLGGILTAFFGLTADQISQLRLAAYDQPIFRILSRPSPERTAQIEKIS